MAREHDARPVDGADGGEQGGLVAGLVGQPQAGNAVRGEVVGDEVDQCQVRETADAVEGDEFGG